MRRPVRAVAASLALALALSSATATATPRQRRGPPGEPARAALDEAKALYVAGNRAVEQGRWADALTDFERSYELSGVPAALFNIATTLRALGRHVEARDAFAQLLAEHKQLDPEVKKKAEEMLAGEKARVAALVLSGLPALHPGLRLLIDGSAGADTGARPLSIDVDPGRHTVLVDEPRSKPFTWEGSLADGEKKTVAVKLAPIEQAPPAATPAATPAAPATPPKEPAKKSGVFSSPVFWGVVGVLVVGGAVAGGYFWNQSQRLEPGSSTVIKL